MKYGTIRTVNQNSRKEKGRRRRLVEMIHAPVDRERNIRNVVWEKTRYKNAPNFTYREIGIQMEKDGRFEVEKMQVCSLKGTDPIELIIEKLNV